MLDLPEGTAVAVDVTDGARRDMGFASCKNGFTREGGEGLRNALGSAGTGRGLVVVLAVVRADTGGISIPCTHTSSCVPVTMLYLARNTRCMIW
jgi:hypothetical protein